MSIRIQKYKAQLVPPSLHKAVIKSIETADGGPQVKVTLEVPECALKGGQSRPARLNTYYNLNLHPKSKLHSKFIKPLIGRELDGNDFENEGFALERLVGKECSVLVEQRESSTGGAISVYSQKADRNNPVRSLI